MRSSDMSSAMSGLGVINGGILPPQADANIYIKGKSPKSDVPEMLCSPPYSPTAPITRNPVRRPGLSRSLSLSENQSNATWGLKIPCPQFLRTETDDDVLRSLTEGSLSRAREAQPPRMSQMPVDLPASEAIASATRRLSAQWSTAQFLFPPDQTEHIHKHKPIALAFGNHTAQRDVDAFVAAYLAAGGHDEALRLFRRRLPLDEQQQHQRTQQLDSSAPQHRGHRAMEMDACGDRWQQRETKEPSPPLSDAMCDLVRTVCDAARREVLLDDTVPWSAVSCQQKDFRLGPLEETQSRASEQSGHTTSGVAVGGSLDRLVEVLILTETDTPFRTGMPNYNYTNVFIVLSSLFVLPEVLVVRLIRLFRHVQKQQFILDDSRSAFLLCRIVQFMLAYCEYHEADMTSPLLNRLLIFVREVLGCMGTLSCSMAGSPLSPSQLTFSSFISDGMPEVTVRLRELSAFAEAQLQRNFIRDAASGVWRRRVDVSLRPLGSLVHFPCPGTFPTQTQTHIDRHVSQRLSGEVSFTQVPVETLAEQLCLLCFRLFLDIHTRELLNNAWSDERLRHGVSQHLSRFVAYAAKLQRFVAAQIVTPASLSDRHDAMCQSVRLAHLLHERQNYEAAAAVLGGLQHPSVSALDAPCAVLPERERAELVALQERMDPFASHGTSSLQSSLSSCVQGDMEAPMVPLLAPVLGVLFRTEESKGRTVVVRQSDGMAMVNWSKVTALGKNIFFWLRCQSMPYGYAPDAEIQEYLWKLPGHQYSDETLMRFAKKRKS